MGNSIGFQRLKNIYQQLTVNVQAKYNPSYQLSDKPLDIPAAMIPHYKQIFLDMSVFPQLSDNGAAFAIAHETNHSIIDDPDAPDYVGENHQNLIKELGLETLCKDIQDDGTLEELLADILGAWRAAKAGFNAIEGANNFFDIISKHPKFKNWKVPICDAKGRYLSCVDRLNIIKQALENPTIQDKINKFFEVKETKKEIPTKATAAEARLKFDQAVQNAKPSMVKWTSEQVNINQLSEKALQDAEQFFDNSTPDTAASLSAYNERPYPQNYLKLFEMDDQYYSVGGDGELGRKEAAAWTLFHDGLDGALDGKITNVHKTRSRFQTIMNSNTLDKAALELMDKIKCALNVKPAKQ
jgi:hypothetical protein